MSRPDFPRLDWSHPLIMGILNVTPDSFSDGGRFARCEAAVAHGLAMAAQGADIIDVGGESTRPGAEPVQGATQRARVLEVIAALHAKLPGHVLISVDTRSASVAEAALAAGAGMINDVSAGAADANMPGVAAAARCPIVLMHLQGTPATMQDDPQYADVVGEVEAWLLARAAVAQAAGVARENILLDPGICFGKRSRHNLQLLAALPRLAAHGYPLLLGVSRKRYMGDLLGALRPEQLEPATCSATAIGVMAGVAVFRVHDVAANRQAADVAHAIRAARGGR